MEAYIKELEEHFKDIPSALQPEVRAFLDEYYQKKDTHSASNLGGLSDKELEELLYLTIRDRRIFRKPSNKKGKELPPQISKCKNLKILVIDADIDDIRVIDAFSDLRILSISELDISENTNAQFKFKNLIYLNIHGNSHPIDFSKNLNGLNKLLICHIKSYFSFDDGNSLIYNFPSNIPNIISIALSGHKLKKLPNFIDYPNLIYLNLGFNTIKEIPSSIQYLKKLKSLLLNSNEIVELPNEIFELQKLEELDLSYNQIVELPNGIFKFKNLKEILFTQNPFQTPSYLRDFSEMLKYADIENELPLFNYLKELNKPTQQSDYNYFNLKIPKTLQTPILQYIEFFKDYVEATKGKEIIFDVKRDQQGLILITNGNTNVTLPELGAYFQEYVALTQQQSEDWIFNFEQRTTALQADIFRLKMENQVAHLKNSLKMAKLESIHLSNQLSDKKAENDFLKSLSQSLSSKIDILITGRTPQTLNVDQLLLDIVDQATKMLERKHSRKIEDLHNDILTDFLRQQDYYATDQTRSGRTTLGVGELDIMIRKKDGTPFSILEAFRLSSCGEKNKKVAEHLDKLLHDYDTAGHERNFAIVYAEAKNFERLWQNYQNYVNELNGKPNFRATYPLISFKEKEGISKKASIKIGIAKHRREGTIVEVYHILINMFV